MKNKIEYIYYNETEKEYIITNLRGRTSGWYLTVPAGIEAYHKSAFNNTYDYRDAEKFVDHIMVRRPNWKLNLVWSGDIHLFREGHPEYFL